MRENLNKTLKSKRKFNYCKKIEEKKVELEIRKQTIKPISCGQWSLTIKSTNA